MKRRVFCSLLAAAAALAAADRFDAVRASIRKHLVAGGVPSLAVAVAQDGRIVWQEGFGWADRERRIAATEHTLYSLASISKPITATGLMVLVQRGEVDPDRPVNEYLGAARLRARVGQAAQATVRRVANHTSGLPLHYQFFYADEPYRPPSMDETILRYGNLVTIPGERYQYSNLGYGVLDYVIARISGKSYGEFMREEVFLPLGLTHMSVDVAPEQERQAATRYGADGLPIPFYGFDHTGASAVWASAHDLARFAMFHLKAHLPDQKAILSDASIEAMQKSTAVSGRHAGYGMGWAISEPPDGYRLVSHSGGMGGVSTTLRLVPSEKLAVIVLCNSGSGVPHRISDEILTAMLPRWRAGGSDGGPRPGRFEPPKELLGSWKGTFANYKAELPMTLRVFESGDIHAQIGGQMKMLWNGVRWQDGYLSGRMPGDAGTEDAGRRPHYLSFTLKLRGSVLNGAASALSQPGRRAGNALTQWVELKKE